MAESIEVEIRQIAEKMRRQLGSSDVALLRRLRLLSKLAEFGGRALLHIFNTFLAASVVFEGCAYNYDRLLKARGFRSASDRQERRKILLFVAYQYILFPLLAGSHWRTVLAGNLAAVLIRNLVASSLQM